MAYIQGDKMEFVYRIKDDKDEDREMAAERAIVTNKQCIAQLMKIKKDTNRIWTAINKGEGRLHKDEDYFCDASVNGAWMNIFGTLLCESDIKFRSVSIEDI